MKYPLYQNAREVLRLPSGRPIEELSLENLKLNHLSNEDLGIHQDTLLLQAQVAEASGFSQLGVNLRRAAELTAIPDKELLRIYEALRPGRMNRDSLLALALEVDENYRAPLTARFIREAAEDGLKGSGPAGSGN